jgi:hypothetical protein
MPACPVIYDLVLLPSMLAWHANTLEDLKMYVEAMAHLDATTLVRCLSLAGWHFPHKVSLHQ